MERNAEQLAWSVLIAAFAVFCLLLAAVPVGVNWYLDHAVAQRPVRLDVIKGTALWLPADGRQEVNAVSRTTLANGDQIRTAANSEALLSFFDGSNVHLWPNTTLRIVQAESTAYRQTETDFVLAQDGGHARYEVAIPATQSRRFQIVTPQGNALLREGSYKVEVGPADTSVTVTNGSATVSHGGEAVEVLKGEWAQVPDGGGPTKPQSDLHNLIANGDFSQDLQDWQPGNRDQQGGPPGQVIVQSQENHRFVELAREVDPHHIETFLHKTVNQDVTDYNVVKFSYQLQIQDQTIAPGATPGTELPLQVRIHYRDSSGSEYTWTRGYLLAANGVHPPAGTVAVQRNFWTDETIDLLDPGVVSPRPATIMWIEFAASGFGYKTDVANVQLQVD